MRWFRAGVMLLLLGVGLAATAYQPSATSPYTFTGCDICGAYSNERVGVALVKALDINEVRVGTSR